MQPVEPDVLEGLDEDALFARAADIRDRMERQVADHTLIHAGRSASDALGDEGAQDMLARQALSRALAEVIQPPAAAKGPARRPRPKVSKRKQQRQARRRQR